MNTGCVSRAPGKTLERDAESRKSKQDLRDRRGRVLAAQAQVHQEAGKARGSGLFRPHPGLGR